MVLSEPKVQINFKLAIFHIGPDQLRQEQELTSDIGKPRHLYLCVSVFGCICIYGYLYLCAFVFVCICISVFMYLSVYVFECICICVYLYK